MSRFIAIVLGLALLIIPAGASADTDPDSASIAPAAASDIVDLAAADGRFTILVAAVQAAGLVDTLRSNGPFTVFAPTDEAFAQLPSGTVDALLNDIPTLTSVLLYHVIAGEVTSDEATQLESAETVSGLPVMIHAGDGTVMVNTSHVVLADLAASNGIVHVIDSVLLPAAN